MFIKNLGVEAMFKKILIFSSTLLLMGCTSEDNDTPALEEESVEDTVEVEEMNSVDEELEEVGVTDTDQAKSNITSIAHLINEKTFVDSYALQAWEDYQELVSNATYGDATLLLDENSDFTDLNGTSLEEIENLTASMNMREDVYTEFVEINEREEIHYYRYPAEEGSVYSETSDFLAELSFYYLENNLIFSSITPGFYSVELNDLPEATNLTAFLMVEEIENLDPQVFTIAEMNISGRLIRQIMIPATHMNEEGNEEILAFYFFTNNENILYYATLPFEMVMQSFPDYSVLLYQELLPDLADLSI